MSIFFNIFDNSGRCVDWFDMLKLFDIFDRSGRSVDSNRQVVERKTMVNEEKSQDIKEDPLPPPKKIRP